MCFGAGLACMTAAGLIGDAPLKEAVGESVLAEVVLDW